MIWQLSPRFYWFPWHSSTIETYPYGSLSYKSHYAGWLCFQFHWYGKAL